MTAAEFFAELKKGICTHPPEYLELNKWEWVRYPNDYSPTKAIRAVYSCRKCEGQLVKWLFDFDDQAKFLSEFFLLPEDVQADILQTENNI